MKLTAIYSRCPFCGSSFASEVRVVHLLRIGNRYHDVCPNCGVSGSMIYLGLKK